MHNAAAHYLLTHSQSIPEQRSNLPGQTPLLGCDVLCCGSSLWPAQVSCPGHACILGHLSLAEHEVLNSPWCRISTAEQQVNHQWAVITLH